MMKKPYHARAPISAHVLELKPSGVGSLVGLDGALADPSPRPTRPLCVGDCPQEAGEADQQADESNSEYGPQGRAEVVDQIILICNNTRVPKGNPTTDHERDAHR